MNDDAPRTYSVAWRLQRTITEDAFVSVPVTEDLLIEQPDGTKQIDVDKMVQRAIELGQNPELVWYPEQQQIEPHPIQMRRPGSDESEPEASP